MNASSASSRRNAVVLPSIVSLPPYRSEWSLLADQRQNERAAMRRATMLQQKNPLPHAELKPAISDRDRQLNLGQGAFDVRRHIVGALVVVAIEGDILRHQPVQKGVEIAQHVRRGVLLDQQRSRGVLEVDGQQPEGN